MNKSTKPIAVVDIDGTIAKVGKRADLLHKNPIDWEQFYADSFDDDPIEDVCDFVRMLRPACEIFFCTSRSEMVRHKTQNWLKKHLGMEPKDYTLIMRPCNDDRPDYISKIDCFESETTQEERERVKFVIEDSMCVAWSWREAGYRTYQVS